MAISPVISTSPAPLEPTRHKKLHAPRANDFQKILSKQINKAKAQPADVRTKMDQIKKTNPSIQKSYNNTVNTPLAKGVDDNGMKIALKELAKQFENQLQSILWTQMFKREDASMAEKMWSSERTNALIEANDELGDFGECVYEELLEEMRVKNKIGR